MVVSSELRTHKVMEAAIRELMGAGTPPRFKFKDTYASIEFPAGYTVPAQATLEAKYNELLALEEDIQKTAIEGDLEVGTSNLFVDTETGSVGIGTTNPFRPLTIESTSYGGLRVKRTTSGGGSAMEFINGNEDIWTVGVGGTGVFGVYNDSIFGEQFLIDTSGNVGIGTDSPQAKLDVRGSIMSSGYILQQNAVCCRYINGGDKTVSSGVKIPFDGIIYDPNNLWSTVSDAFVAPVGGVYLVHVNLLTDNSTSYDGNHEVYVNGSILTPRHRGFGTQTGQNYHRSANSHFMISLQAGDEVSIHSTGNGVWYGHNTYAHSHVSIHLISDV